MPLTKMIDLIAEVAAKRAAQGREPKEDASDAVWSWWGRSLANWLMPDLPTRGGFTLP